MRSLPDYNIHIGDVAAPFAEFLASHRFTKYIIIADSNTADCCVPMFCERTGLRADAVIVMPAGELHKNIGTCETIWQQMLDAGTDRHSLVINIGGGVVGDLGGFCAATYMRGVSFVQVPTTLLSQVDSSIGGKLGIDFGSIKNSIGVFGQPAAVFVCPDFLATLPPREIRSGFAEMLKHALIADAGQWQTLHAITPDAVTPWATLIEASLDIKRQIVEADPFERGIRKALNFGHTVGHAIESYLLADTEHSLLHGEAVAFGMWCEAYLSRQLCGLPDADYRHIRDTVARIYGRVSLDRRDYPTLIRLMQRDKKNKSGHISCSLLPAIGSVRVDCIVPPDLMGDALDALKSDIAVR